MSKKSRKCQEFLHYKNRPSSILKNRYIRDKEQQASNRLFNVISQVPIQLKTKRYCQIGHVLDVYLGCTIPEKLIKTRKIHTRKRLKVKLWYKCSLHQIDRLALRFGYQHERYSEPRCSKICKLHNCRTSFCTALVTEGVHCERTRRIFILHSSSFMITQQITYIGKNNKYSEPKVPL